MSPNPSTSPPRPAASGRRRPRRSETRPTTGLIAASSTRRSLEADSSASASSTVCRAPRQPAGSASRSVPAAYAPASAPASPFVSPSSSRYAGSSGVIAA